MTPGGTHPPPGIERTPTPRAPRDIPTKGPALSGNLGPG